MAIATIPLHPDFAAELSGIDTRKPPSEADIAAIEDAMDRHGVLVMRDQDLSDDEQLAFTGHFGRVERAIPRSAGEARERRLGPSIGDISNIGRHNQLLPRDDRQRLMMLGNQYWHSDRSFRKIPTIYTFLSARQIPATGGETQYADMRAAYDALDTRTKAEIDSLICEHSLLFSRSPLGFEVPPEDRARFAPVLHPLVRTHPVTGRRSLYLSSHAGGIVGWPTAEARTFLRDLLEHATQPQFVYTHQWRRLDLVMWDNRQTIHRGRPWRDREEIRDLHRTSVIPRAIEPPAGSESRAD